MDLLDRNFGTENGEERDTYMLNGLEESMVRLVSKGQETLDNLGVKSSEFAGIYTGLGYTKKDALFFEEDMQRAEGPQARNPPFLYCYYN